MLLGIYKSFDSFFLIILEQEIPLLRRLDDSLSEGLGVFSFFVLCENSTNTLFEVKSSLCICVSFHSFRS